LKALHDVERLQPVGYDGGEADAVNATPLQDASGS
jgi:hypothetical protein